MRDLGRPSGGRISKLLMVLPVYFTGPSHMGQIAKFNRGLKMGIIPHATHNGIFAPSERSINDSLTKDMPPCAIMASRSISPIFNPPCDPRPPVG